MATLKGVDLKTGLAIASAWGTMVDPSTNEQWPCESLSFNYNRARIANNELTDTSMRKAGTAGLESVTVSANKILHYQGDEIPLAMGMGTAGNPSQVGTTTYYTHTLTQKQDLSGIFASMAADMEVSTYEVQSLKVASFSISGKAGEYVKLGVEFIGNDLDLAGDCTMSGVTENSAAALNFVTFGQGVFRYNTQSSGALSSTTDDVYPSEFSFNYSNPMASFTTSQNHPNIDEPLRNGFSECSGSLTFPKYSSNTILSALQVHTAYKMDMTFTSGSYSFTINIPYLVWTGDIPSVSGPGLVPLTLNWEAEQASSNPTGMSDTTPYLVVVSQLATNPLA